MANSVHLEDIINALSFHKIQDSMAEVADMAMLTVDFAGVPVTEHSRRSEFCTLVRSRPDLGQLCRKCDSRGGIEAARLREPYLYLCHMGVLDFAVPIIVEGQYIGAIMAGQVRMASQAERDQLEQISEPLPGLLGEDNLAFVRVLEEAREKLPLMGLGRARAVARMMFQVCNYIVEEALLKMQVADRRPLSLDDGSAPRMDSPVLRAALDYIRDNPGRSISLEAMARLCGISESYFSKLFNRTLGEGLAAYVNRVRLKRAREMLLSTDKAITAIALHLGYEDPGYFDKVFRRAHGMSPRAYRQKHQTPR